jgi:ketosteroid isomerase-like protein
MLICKKCNIEYEDGKKFCKNCGSPLVIKEESIPSIEDRGLSGGKKTEEKLFCPSCKLVYETGKFCRKCGVPLVTQVPPQKEEESKEIYRPEVKDELPQIQIPEQKPIMESGEKLFCPGCNIFYESGRFCKKCGASLVSKVPVQEKEEPKTVPPPDLKREISETPPLERKPIKKLSKEWLRLTEEKKKLEVMINKLQSQRGTISNDVFNTTYNRYKAQLESISSRYQQIETNLKSVRKKASEEIDLLNKKLQPIKKRLDEVRSLFKLGAVTKADFSKEKKELGREIKLGDKAIKSYQQIINSLPDKRRETIVPLERAQSFLRPLPIAAGCVIILIAVAAYLLWPTYSYLIKKPFRSIPFISKKEAIPPVPLASSTTKLSPDLGTQEIEKIKSLFQKIREANLQKNIDLYMSCYSLDFKDRESKKVDTLENWNNFNYLDLSYNLKTHSISGDTANARVEWLIKISPKAGGQPEESRSVLDYILKKENEDWKINEIKPVG